MKTKKKDEWLKTEELEPSDQAELSLLVSCVVRRAGRLDICREELLELMECGIRSYHLPSRLQPRARG